MSGDACKNRAHRPLWWIRDYRCNYSAFNGYHETWSEYSAIICAAPREMGYCRNDTQINNLRWRTKAAYVDDLSMVEPSVLTVREVVEASRDSARGES